MSPLRPIAALTLAAVVAVSGAGCSTGSSKPAAETSTATTTTTAPARQVSHAAPDLEALLPHRVGSTRLQTGSTTGAAVFGGDAFSREMTRLLTAAGKQPSDLRFANSQDPKGKLELEIGVFSVEGMSAAKLRRAIVASSRPNAPGLAVSSSALGGKPVTMVVYPGGTILYLYEHGDRVFYVGTQNEGLAREVLGMLP